MRALENRLTYVWHEKKMNRNGPTMFSINTDQQLRIELSSILNGSDVVQGKTFLIFLLDLCIKDAALLFA